MPTDDAASFASIPWKAVEDGSDTIGWHKHHVPYVASPLSLQNFDIWVPATSSEAPVPHSVPALPGRWVVFIHGGAWRDAFVNSSAFNPTAQNLLKAAAAGRIQIAGLVSINYRLTCYPDHPTDPSPPKDGSAPDPARLAHHPDHISDVITALAFLQSMGVATDDYILSGHSCGATLAFQAVMDSKRWAPGLPAPRKPSVVLGLNGLYDLAGFVASPPESHAGLLEGYLEFMRAAFGDDPEVWKAVCPTTAGNWVAEWTGGKRVVLVQSRKDGLVSYSQLEGLRAHLKACDPSFEVVELEAGGGHDYIWVDGTRMAEIYEEVLNGLP